LRLVFGDPGRFVKNRAPILRARGEDQVDLPLLQERVGGPPDPRVH
jgi:hypothetical protein